MSRGIVVLPIVLFVALLGTIPAPAQSEPFEPPVIVPEGSIVYSTCPGADNGVSRCFESDGSTTVEAEVFELSGSNAPRRVTHNNVEELRAVWSPDQRRAAVFAPDRSREESCGLYTLGRDSGETKLLFPTSDYFCPRSSDWSSNGRWILFESWSADSDPIGNVRKIRPSGGRLTLLTNHDWGVYPSDSSFVGRDIVFVKNNSYDVDKNGIVRMSAQGANKRFIQKGGFTSRLSVSPDETRIAYTHRGKGGYRLHLMRSDGSNKRKIGAHAPGFDDEPTWSPNSRQVAFVTRALRSEEETLYIYRLRSKTFIELPLPEDSSYVSDLTWSPSGSYLAYSTSLRSEVGYAAFFVRVGDSTVHRLTKASYQHSLLGWLSE